jgi:hypothetical protein
MKPKSKNTSFPAKAQTKLNDENARRQAFWQRVGLRLAAVFLVIVLLASECSALLPVE